MLLLYSCANKRARYYSKIAVIQNSYNTLLKSDSNYTESMNEDSNKYVGEFIAKRVNELLAENQIKNKKTLSQLTGHSENLVSNLVNKKYNPTVSTIYDVCQHFGITLEDFFRIDYSNNKSISALMELISKKFDKDELNLLFKLVNVLDKETLQTILKAFVTFSESENTK